MERQYIIIVAFIAIFASSCQQTETLFIQKQVIDPIEEIIPVQLDTPEKEVEKLKLKRSLLPYGSIFKKILNLKTTPSIKLLRDISIII
jgi:hypothetical protein